MSELSGEVEHGRGLMLGGALVMLLLSGVAVWAFAGEGEEDVGGGEAVAAAQSMGGGTAGEEGSGLGAGVELGVVTLAAKQAPSLGELSFEACDPQCRRVHLKELTSTEALLVVNVWATWCEPCLREMALFRELEGWGEKIRFAPIELLAARDEARYEVAMAAMPPTLVRLHDYTGGIVAGALREKGVFEEGKGGGVPQTLILDCEGRARVIYPREIVDVGALRDQIEALVAEMPACAARRQERERAAAAAREVAEKAEKAAAAESAAQKKKNSAVKDAKKCRPRCKAGLKCKEIAGGRFKCV
jgi:thiol-disulfide isomerase/thioredoxin